VKQKSFSLTSRNLLGLVVLSLGTILTLGNFEIIDARAVIRFWPVLLIVFGAIKLLEPGSTSGRTFGGVIAVLGVIMVLNRMDIFDLDIWAFWPLLLVAAGASLIWRKHGEDVKIPDDDSTDQVSGVALLGGLEQTCSSQHFRGGSISAILGGHEVDLRDADIPEGETAVLDILTFMGGVELRVPADWTIVLDGTAFLGGFDSKARGNPAVNKRLVIKGQTVMGGVEIRN